MDQPAPNPPGPGPITATREPLEDQPDQSAGFTPAGGAEPGRQHAGRRTTALADGLTAGADPARGESGFLRAAAAAGLYGNWRVEAGTLKVHHGDKLHRGAAWTQPTRQRDEIRIRLDYNGPNHADALENTAGVRPFRRGARARFPIYIREFSFTSFTYCKTVNQSFHHSLPLIDTPICAQIPPISLNDDTSNVINHDQSLEVHKPFSIGGNTYI